MRSTNCPYGKCCCDMPLDENGRCTATPSCSDFRRPHQRVAVQRKLTREKEKKETGYIGIYRGVDSSKMNWGKRSDGKRSMGSKGKGGNHAA